jgi:hypothetical protein
MNWVDKLQQILFGFIRNMSVVACVHNLTSKGAMELKDLFAATNRSQLVELDVTKNDSVVAAEKFLKEFLEKNKELGRK